MGSKKVILDKQAVERKVLESTSKALELILSDIQKLDKVYTDKQAARRRVLESASKALELINSDIQKHGKQAAKRKALESASKALEMVVSEIQESIEQAAEEKFLESENKARKMIHFGLRKYGKVDADNVPAFIWEDKDEQGRPCYVKHGDFLELARYSRPQRKYSTTTNKKTKNISKSTTTSNERPTTPLPTDPTKYVFQHDNTHVGLLALARRNAPVPAQRKFEGMTGLDLNREQKQWWARDARNKQKAKLQKELERRSMTPHEQMVAQCRAQLKKEEAKEQWEKAEKETAEFALAQGLEGEAKEEHEKAEKEKKKEQVKKALAGWSMVA